jgi:hypothetical protein
LGPERRSAGSAVGRALPAGDLADLIQD